MLMAADYEWEECSYTKVTNEWETVFIESSPTKTTMDQTSDNLHVQACHQRVKLEYYLIPWT